LRCRHRTRPLRWLTHHRLSPPRRIFSRRPPQTRRSRPRYVRTSTRFDTVERVRCNRRYPVHDRMATPDAASASAVSPLGAPSPRRNRRWVRYILFTTASVAILVIVIAGAFVFWLRSAAKAALPQLDGDIHLSAQGSPSLSALVTVRRDQH